MNRRARILGLVAGVLIAALLVGTASWVIVNSADSAAPDVSDLVPGGVPVSDQKNAYTYLSKALASLQWPKDKPYLEAALDAWDDALVVDLLSRNGAALALLEQGLACPAYQSYTSGLQSQGLDSWARVVMLLAQKAAYESRIGRRDIACQDSCSLLRLGSWVASRPRSLDEWYSGRTMLELGLEGVERLLLEAELSEDDLVRLLGQLNRVDALDAGLAEAFETEFQRIDEAIDEYALRVPRGSPWAGHVFQPNRTRETAAQFYRALIQNTALPYAQVRLPHVPPLPLSGMHRYLLPLQPNKQGRRLYGLFLPEQYVMEHCFVWKCRIQSDLDGLRLVAACRLYETRHSCLPDTLTALVPEVLGAVARDPFDGQPFRYRREDAVVYSVGQDLKDSWATRERAPAPLPASHTAGPVEASDWPQYPSPRRLLSLARYGTADLVYRIHAETK